jgi:glycosyltransferase involved in cell wall biosynthesis
MKKVLMVTYALPPVGGAGVQRTAKFIKYLNYFGWEPIVLSVKNPSVPTHDPFQIIDIPPGTKIFKARTLEPNYRLKRKFITGKDKPRNSRSITKLIKWLTNGLMIPDPQILWWPGLMLSLWKIIKKESVDCLFVSAPPFSSLIPVVYTGKALGIPVVIDFRDNWKFYRLHMENATKTTFAKMMDRVLEKYAILNCSAFTTATASYVKNISDRYFFSKDKRGYVITNGFDKEDFNSFQEKILPNRMAEKIHFLYSGTVWKATSLLPLMKAINSIATDYPDIDKKIRITIMGRIVDQELYYFLNRRLQDILHLRGYVPHGKAIETLFRADVLIIALSDIEGADQIIPAKTFEYVATGKKILAIVPEGETSRLLDAEYANAAIFHPNETDLIATYILRLLENKSLVFGKKKTDVAKYERKFLTGKLAEIFSSLTEKVAGA